MIGAAAVGAGVVGVGMRSGAVDARIAADSSVRTADSVTAAFAADAQLQLDLATLHPY